MDWKNMVKKTCVAALAAFALMTPQASAAEEEPTIVADAPSEGEQQEMTSEEALQAYKDSGYKYTSQRYGYSIICPTKPTVVPLSVLFGDDEDARGDVLIFKSAGYDISYGWIVMVDAFDEDMIPDDITKQPEAKQKDYVEKFMANSPYEFIRLTEVDGRSGVYAVDAKEIEVDTNGDGKYDEVMRKESQMIKTFFRGAYGGRFGVMLMENPDLTQGGIAYYQFGLLTFQEWPTKMENGSNTNKNDKNKKDKKDKKDKTDKNDKKK